MNRLVVFAVLAALAFALGGCLFIFHGDAPEPATTVTPDLYDQQPDIAHCVPGRLKASEKTAAIELLNTIRRLHGLTPVTYDASGDEAVMAASLIMAAQGRTSHFPPPTWHCYTPAGALGARTSNLGGGGHLSNKTPFMPSEGYFCAWMIEYANPIAENVGHRRWMLDPFLQKVAFGNVSSLVNDSTASGAALQVLTGGGTTGHAHNGLVAYPYGDYPARFFRTDALLSFSVLADSLRPAANSQVSFSNATVEVRPRGGAPLAVSSVRADNEGYGLPNNLQFRVAGLQAGTQYDVRIGNVSLPGRRADYAYWFRISQ